MKTLTRPRDALAKSAIQRFPQDAAQQAAYIQWHLDQSESHDAATYTIRADVFASMRAEALAKWGPRESLRTATQQKPPRDQASRKGFTDAERATARMHADICRACDKAGDIVEAKNGWELWRVKCQSQRCSACSGHVALTVAGACPERKW